MPHYLFFCSIAEILVVAGGIRSDDAERKELGSLEADHYQTDEGLRV